MLHIRLSNILNVCGFLFGLVVPFVSGRHDLQAEIKVVDLPRNYADFAFNPESGTIASIDSEMGEVLIYELEDQVTGKAKPSASLKVGLTPCSIFYKKYQQRHYFAIVCTKDSNLFLVEEEKPSPQKRGTFKLAGKIDLEKTDISSVTGSRNPEDPNIYYCYGSGHESVAGAVTLKSMKNTTFAFRDSMDCSVSAGGLIIYHRGPWSPSGFKSASRANPLEEETPIFAPLFSEHRSAAEYLPDPLDTYTACGAELYSRNLDKKIATLPFLPVAFFKTKPIIIGMKDPSNRFYTEEKDQSGLKLMAASYNTFTQVGTSVSLDHRLDKEPRLIPSGRSGNGDFKRIIYRYRVFADDARQRVLFANGKQLQIIDLEDFEVPQEPLLASSFAEVPSFIVGEEKELTLQAADPSTKFSVEDKPEGMKLNGNKLRWTPTLEQIGTFPLSISLSVDELKATQLMEVEVTYPSIRLPFSPTGFALDETGTKGLIWDGSADPSADELANYARNPTRTAGTVQMALIDLKTGTVDVERKLSEKIGTALIAGDLILLKAKSSNTTRCDVLALKDLQRIKSIVTDSPITKMAVLGNHLALATQTGRIDIYDKKNFEKVKSFDRPQVNPGNFIIDGAGGNIFAQGILWDAELKPALLLAPNIIPAMGPTRDFTSQEFIKKPENFNVQMYANQPPTGTGQNLVAFRVIPDSNVRLRLNKTHRVDHDPNSPTVARVEHKLVLTAEGAIDATQVITRTQGSVNYPNEAKTSSPLMETTSKEAYVISDKKLYRWKIPSPPEGAEDLLQPLSWNQRSTTITILDTGKTELQHQVFGGKSPYSFGLAGNVDGLSVDEKSGTVTVDNAAVQAAAEKFLVDYINSKRREQTRLATLRLMASELIGPATELLGQRPKGMPVAIPIQLLVTDDNIGNLAINYFVVAEVNSPKLMATLRKLDEQKAPEPAEVPNFPNPRRDANAPDNPNDAREIERLNKKVEQLEQRIDLMTRQFNEVLKKLDELDRKAK